MVTVIQNDPSSDGVCSTGALDVSLLGLPGSPGFGFRLVALTFAQHFDLICRNIKQENFVNVPVVAADLQVGATIATLSRRIL